MVKVGDKVLLVYPSNSQIAQVVKECPKTYMTEWDHKGQVIRYRVKAEWLQTLPEGVTGVKAIYWVAP